MLTVISISLSFFSFFYREISLSQCRIFSPQLFTLRPFKHCVAPYPFGILILPIFPRNFSPFLYSFFFLFLTTTFIVPLLSSTQIIHSFSLVEQWLNLNLTREQSVSSGATRMPPTRIPTAANPPPPPPLYFGRSGTFEK